MATASRVTCLLSLLFQSHRTLEPLSGLRYLPCIVARRAPWHPPVLTLQEGRHGSALHAGGARVSRRGAEVLSRGAARAPSPQDGAGPAALEGRHRHLA